MNHDIFKGGFSMESKPCIDSLTVKTSNVLPPHTNAYGTLFGGKLMEHIDDVAAISAARHARSTVVTASTDSVDFLNPVKEGDTICVEAFVRSEEHTSELQSRFDLVCRLLLEKKNKKTRQ